MKKMNEIIVRRKKVKRFFKKLAVLISYFSEIYERKKENDYFDNISGRSTKIKTYGKM